MKLAFIAVRNIRRNTRRSVLSASAILLVCAAIVMATAYLEGMKKDMSGNIINYQTGQIRIRNSAYDRYETLNPLHLRIQNYQLLLDRIGQSNSFRTWIASLRLRLSGTFYQGDKSYDASGMGVDFQQEDRFIGLKDKLLGTGRIPSPQERGVLLGLLLAKKMNVGQGDKVTLLTYNMYQGPQGITFTVTGLVDFQVGGLNKSLFLVPLQTVQSLLQMPNAVTEILLKEPAASGTFAKDLDRNTLSRSVAALSDLLADQTDMYTQGPPLSILDWAHIGENYGLVDYMNKVSIFMALIFFILGSTVILNTTIMVIFERMREIGTLAALGMKGRQIVWLFFLEAFFISFIASLLGVILGTLITWPFAVHGFDFSKLFENIDFNVSNVVYPVVNFKSTVLVFFFSITVASAASFLPSRRAARIEPTEALKAI